MVLPEHGIKLVLHWATANVVTRLNILLKTLRLI